MPGGITSAGVRTSFDLKIDFPILDRGSEARVIREVQRRVTTRTRRELVKPWRPRLPKRTGTRQIFRGIATRGRQKGGRVLTPPGNLRRTFGARRPRRPRERGYFIGAQVHAAFYFHWQPRAKTPTTYAAWRKDLAEFTARVIPDELGAVMLEERI